jgi:hypothetical protein
VEDAGAWIMVSKASGYLKTRLVADVRAQVVLHYSVDALGLAVGLRVEGGGEATIDAQTITNLFPELGCELRSSVQDDGQGQPMQPEDVLDEQIGEALLHRTPPQYLRAYWEPHCLQQSSHRDETVTD